MSVSRKRALLLLAAACAIPACGAAADLRIGWSEGTDAELVAAVYGAALERHGFRVRISGYESRDGCVDALIHRDVDVLALFTDSRALSDDMVWLNPSPANFAACLLTTPYMAEKYGLVTIDDCARVAPRLRAAISNDLFLGGEMSRLQRAYSLRFGHVVRTPVDAQYYALGRGDADVANGSAANPRVAEEQLIVLGDDRKFWPRRTIAPVIRIADAHAHPEVPLILNRVSNALEQFAVQQLTMRLDILDADPRDVARSFVKRVL